jgi:hypothetical protein
LHSRPKKNRHLPIFFPNAFFCDACQFYDCLDNNQTMASKASPKREVTEAAAEKKLLFVHTLVAQGGSSHLMQFVLLAVT